MTILSVQRRLIVGALYICVCIIHIKKKVIEHELCTYKYYLLKIYCFVMCFVNLCL